MRNRRRKNGGKYIFIFLVALGVALFAYFLMNARITPVLNSMSINRAKEISTSAVNSAIGAVLKKQKYNYDSLMSLEKDSDGNITAVKADTLEIDRLKYEVTNEIIKTSEKLKGENFTIPLGTVIGGQLFTGKGPDINVRIMPIGNVQTEIDNKFSSAGINQTRQQVYVNVRAQVSIIVSIYSIDTSIDTNYCIADTIIVGKVPDSYTVVGEDSGGDVTGKVFTFGRNGNNSTGNVTGGKSEKK